MDLFDDTVSKIVQDIKDIPDLNPETTYLGGGTPSLLSGADLARIINTIPATNAKEITIEVNPDDIDIDYCKTLLDLGFNRISIGVQSFFDSHLRQMNRRHDSKKALQALEAAQKAGFKNVTIDLIYGLPFMTDKEWEQNLDIATTLGIQHVSAYHLTIEQGTVFYKKKLEPVSEKTSEQHYQILCEKMSMAGFIHYEISNFAKPGFESMHNSGYWSGKPYIGIGPSAHSFDGKNRRWWQPSDIRKWLNGEESGEEILSPEERTEEIIMTALRTSKGLHTDEKEILKKSAKFIEEGYMSYKDGYLAILPEHFLVSDYIISQIV